MWAVHLYVDDLTPGSTCLQLDHREEIKKKEPTAPGNRWLVQYKPGVLQRTWNYQIFLNGFWQFSSEILHESVAVWNNASDIIKRM